MKAKKAKFMARVFLWRRQPDEPNFPYITHFEVIPFRAPADLDETGLHHAALEAAALLYKNTQNWDMSGILTGKPIYRLPQTSEYPHQRSCNARLLCHRGIARRPVLFNVVHYGLLA